ncbi:MAG: DUF3822 family protein [Bacteroidales bacterium]|nr:DUF3822 family protein [Bacteroidales bacterium]
MQINLIDKSFKTEKAAQYDLSVQINGEGLSYCIFDPEKKQHVALRKYGFSHQEVRGDLVKGIAGILADDDLMGLPFQSVRFMVYSQQSTLVPAYYFDRKHLQDYLSFNHALEPTDELFCNDIKPLGAWNVFAIPSGIVSLLNNQFEHIIFAQQATPFLWPAVKSSGYSGGYRIEAGLNHDFLDVAVFSDHKLLLYNTFQYKDENDLLYFMLYICKRMDIDVREVPLIISGELCTKLVLFDTLKKYIPELSYADAPDTCSLAPGLFAVSFYKFQNLLSLHICVSSEENTEERA